MSSEFGHLLKISVFGQSHGAAIGVVMDGLPAGEAVDLDALQAFLDRRRPGKNALSTLRKETDRPTFLSGLENGITCGAPLCAVIQNSDQHSSDYSELRDKPRPGHADYTAFVKWQGQADMRGGGHFSGRLTAPLCIAGGIAWSSAPALPPPGPAALPTTTPSSSPTAAWSRPPTTPAASWAASPTACP